MNRNKDPVTISRADITILDQEIFRVLGEVWSFDNADSWGTVGLERCWGELRVSEPGEIAAVELDVLCGDRECVVLGMRWIERDLCGLDLTDDMKGGIVLADAERDGQLTTTGVRVDSKRGVARGNELGSVSRVPGRSEVDRAFQVGEDADGFGLITLSRRGVVSTGHDDCELDLEAELE